MDEKVFEVRDTRNGSWLWVYNAVVSDKHLTASDKLVYSGLASYSGNGGIYPSMDTLSQRCNVSRRQVILSVAKLVEVGYVSYAKGGGRGHSNRYVLCKMPEGCNRCTVSVVKGAKSVKERVQPLHPNKTEKQEREKKHISFSSRYGVSLTAFSKMSRLEQDRIVKKIT